MEEKDLVSIIVPFYNAEKTLERCINSICNQIYGNIEILLINDGSIDNSLQLCERFSQIDKRIKIISKVNRGVSAARNLGIELAMGKYIGFVDADDYIDPNMYSSMYESIKEKNEELIICNYYKVYAGKCLARDEFISIKEDDKCLKEELLHKIICVSDSAVIGSCCRMLVSREFLINNTISFELGIKMCEDMIFLIKCVDAADSISLNRKQLYYICINKASTTSRYIDGIWEDMMVLISLCKDIILKKYPQIGLEEGIRECIANSVIVTIRNVCKKGTPYNFFQRIKYGKALCHQQFVKKAIRGTFLNKNSFSKKTWPQIICIALGFHWLVVLYHSLKYKTI